MRGVIVCFLTYLLLIPTPASAQEDGRGVMSATFAGTIKGYQHVDYQVSAKAGQTLSVDLEASNASAYFNIMQSGADEALFHNTKGELCEGTTSNVFLVNGGRVLTPPLSSGCLPGTTRARVITLCCTLGIPVAEETLTPVDLAAAAEVFTTSATRGVVPVRSVDRAAYEPGEITCRLREILGRER